MFQPNRQLVQWQLEVLRVQYCIYNNSYILFQEKNMQKKAITNTYLEEEWNNF